MWGIGSVRTVGVVRGRVYGVSNVNSLKMEPLRIVLRSLSAPIELRKCCRDIGACMQDIVDRIRYS